MTKDEVADALDEIGTLLERFPPTECANYFRNSGYTST